MNAKFKKSIAAVSAVVLAAALAAISFAANWSQIGFPKHVWPDPCKAQWDYPGGGPLATAAFYQQLDAIGINVVFSGLDHRRTGGNAVLDPDINSVGGGHHIPAVLGFPILAGASAPTNLFEYGGAVSLMGRAADMNYRILVDTASFDYANIVEIATGHKVIEVNPDGGGLTAGIAATSNNYGDFMGSLVTPQKWGSQTRERPVHLMITAKIPDPYTPNTAEPVLRIRVWQENQRYEDENYVMDWELYRYFYVEHANAPEDSFKLRYIEGDENFDHFWLMEGNPDTFLMTDAEHVQIEFETLDVGVDVPIQIDSVMIFCDRGKQVSYKHYYDNENSDYTNYKDCFISRICGIPCNNTLGLILLPNSAAHRKILRHRFNLSDIPALENEK